MLKLVPKTFNIKSEPEVWGCCWGFRMAEDNELIAITEYGYVLCDQISEDQIGVMDIVYCPFCACKLPVVKETYYG